MNKRHVPTTPSSLDMERLEGHLINILSKSKEVSGFLNKSTLPFLGSVTKDTDSFLGQILNADPSSDSSENRIQNASVYSSPFAAGELVTEEDSSRKVVSSRDGNLHEDAESEVHPCHQKVETGLCRGHFPRWYFNVTDGTCNSFTYGGCRGNKNNFDKDYKCYAACSDKIPCPTDPQKVCRMSESICVNATCPSNPDAECAVLPCTCQAVFEDPTGQVVDCEVTANSSMEPDVVNIDLINPSTEADVEGRLAPSKVPPGDEPDVSRPDVGKADIKENHLAPSMVPPGWDINVQPEQDTGIIHTSKNDSITSESTPVPAEEEDLPVSTVEGGVTDAVVTKGGQPDVTESSVVPTSTTEIMEEVTKSGVFDTENTITTAPPANTTDSSHELFIGSTVAIICFASLAATILVLSIVLCYYRWKRTMKFDPIVGRPGLKHESSEVESLNRSPSTTYGDV